MKNELLVVGNIAQDIIFGAEQFGGSAAVISINASQLGARTSLLSVVGSDDFSNKYRRLLDGNKVDVGMLETVLDILPQCIVSSVDNKSTSVEWIDNNCHPAMEELNPDPFTVKQYEVVHIVSSPPRLSRKLAENSTRISYEPGPYILTDSQYFDPIVVQASKFIFLNNEEYQAACEITGYKSYKDFVHGSERILVVTNGEHGSSIFYMQGITLQHIVIEPFLPTQIVDHTGAGDAYKAGFLVGIVKKRSLKECGTIGSFMGALCVAQEGGIVPADKLSQVKAKFNL